MSAVATRNLSANATKCPISRGEFREHAVALPVCIGEQLPLDAEVKEFSTGSLGWYLTHKVDVVINGKRCKVQVGVNLTIVGSKELPQD